VILLGKASTAMIYEAVAFIGYALPGLTFYYALRHLSFPSRAAFAAGLSALVLPAFFDGATGLFIGMVGSRIGWALSALVLVWTMDWLEGRDAWHGWLAILALAAVILAHPYHVIGLLSALGLYALVRRLPIVRAGLRVLIVIVSALALDAFWLAPLFAHSSTEMIPVIRSTLDQTWRVMTDAWLLPYVLLALPMLPVLRRERDPGKRTVVIMLLALPFLLAGVILGTHVVLINQFHIYQIDPVRMIGEYYLAWIWLAALGITQIGQWIADMAPLRRIPGSITSWAVTLCLGAVLAIPFTQSAGYYQPKPGDEPRFLSQAIRDYRLDEFWATLRKTPGRVLFTSYLTQLRARGTEAFPTTLAALTPLFSGRAIVGGTYTAWSPIAAQLWVGTTHPSVLWGLSQDQQDRSLFGIPLEELSDAQLADYSRRLNISAIVAGVDDYQTRVLLDASPRFQSYYNNGLFFVYKIKDLQPSWIEAKAADIELVSLSDDRIELYVRSAQANAHVGIKVYAYPLWRAYAAGASMPITRDDLALMDIALPRGDNYTVTVRYEPGMAENMGDLVSITSLLCFAAIGAFMALTPLKRRLHLRTSRPLQPRLQ
jgi:hypothetical protein